MTVNDTQVTSLSRKKRWLILALAMIGLGGTGMFAATHNAQASSINNSSNSESNLNSYSSMNTQKASDNTVNTSTSSINDNNVVNNTPSASNNQNINRQSQGASSGLNNNSNYYDQTNTNPYPESSSNNGTDTTTSMSRSRIIYNNITASNQSRSQNLIYNHNLGTNLTKSSSHGSKLPNHGIWDRQPQKTVFKNGNVGDKSAPTVGTGELGTDRNAYYDYSYAIGQAEEGVQVNGDPIWLHWHPATNMAVYWYHNEPGSQGTNTAPEKVHKGTWYFWVQPGPLTSQNKNGGGPSSDNTTSDIPTSSAASSSDQTPANPSDISGASDSKAPSNNGNGDSPNNSVTTPSGPSTGNGTNGGGNGTQGGNGDSPDNANPNNATPNNSNPNNANPNNANPNNANIVVPNGPNNNNVFPAGGGSSNNNLMPSGPIFNNTGSVNDQAIIGALVDNEDRNEQDAINRLDSDEKTAESQASTQSAQQVAQSLANVSAAERGKNALQVAKMQESARMQSLTNAMSSNAAQQSIRSSAASTKVAYMNRINSDHANMNSAAQDVLDEMSSLFNLTPQQKTSAINALQREESSFMSAANTTNSTEDAGLNTNMNASIHHLEANLKNTEAADQASQASSAMSGVNSYSTDFGIFMNSFSGLTSAQASQLNHSMSSDTTTASYGISANRANESILNSLVTSVASDVTELEAQGKSASTSNSNLATSLASSSASSADGSLRAHTDAEVNSVENNSGFSPNEKSAIVAALESAEASDEAHTNAKIIAGRDRYINENTARSANESNTGSLSKDQGILNNPVSNSSSSNNNNNSSSQYSYTAPLGYNPYGYNGPATSTSTSSNEDTGLFQKGYNDAETGYLNEGEMDNSPEYRKGYNAYMNGYHDGLNSSQSLKSFYQNSGNKSFQVYMRGYRKGYNTRQLNVKSNTSTMTGSRLSAQQSDNEDATNSAHTINRNDSYNNPSMNINTVTSANGKVNHESQANHHNGQTLPKTGEQTNSAMEAGGAGLAALGAAVMTDLDKHRHEKEKGSKSRN